MTMDARQDFKRPGADEPQKRTRLLEERRGGPRHGAGLYAEVRPTAELRSITLETLEDAD